MSLLSRLTGLFRGRHLDSDLDDELRSHLEMRVEQNLAAGMTPEEARRDAALRFGNRALMKEDARRADILPWVESFGQDVRYGLRMLRKAPVFTLVAIATLALGIGANTAIFTLTHALLLRSLPVADPDRLVRVTFRGSQDFGLSGPMYDELKKRNRVFSGMLAWSPQRLNFSDGSEVRELRGALASGDAFATLGVNATLGRVLTPEDDHPGGGRDGWAAVISDDFWRERFNADPGILGRVLRIEDISVTIVGVTPPGFEGPNVGARPQIMVPLELEAVLHPKMPQRHFGTALWLTVMGRLKPSVTVAQARADVERIGPGIVHDTDANGLLLKGFFRGSSLSAESGRTGRAFVRDRYRQPLVALQALVGIILLICCANLAGLMAARASARRHEFAIRAALGAERLRMVRQLLVEGSLLAVAGAALGLLFAHWATQALVHTLMRHNPLLLDLSPDLGVLLFTTAAAVLAALGCGIPSGLRAARVDPIHDLKDGERATGGRTRMEAWLVSGQIALAAVLLVAAGLFSGTLYRLLQQDPGFSTQGVLLVPTNLRGVPRGKWNQVYGQVLEQLNGRPGVLSASAEAIPLISGWVSSGSYKSLQPDGSERSDSNVFYNRVGPAYFATAGTRLLAGRDVATADRPDQHKVCWINASAAGFFFPGANAVGQFLHAGESKQPDAGCEVVGVAQDAKYTNLRADAPRMVYFPFQQAANPGDPADALWLMVRTDQPEAANASVRAAIHTLAPGAPLLDAISIRDLMLDSVGSEQALAMVTSFFAALGLLLTAIGVYGLLSYRVTRRTREIGLRIALGARRGQVLGMVVRQALLLSALGLAAGLAVSMGLARFISGMMFGMKALDAPTFLAAALVLAIAAVVASYLPARRATRVDPMIALRYE